MGQSNALNMQDVEANTWAPVKALPSRTYVSVMPQDYFLGILVHIFAGSPGRYHVHTFMDANASMLIVEARSMIEEGRSQEKHGSLKLLASRRTPPTKLACGPPCRQLNFIANHYPVCILY